MKTNKKFKVHIVSMYLYTPGMPFQWMTALSPPLRGGSGSALKRWAGDVKVWKGERRGVYVYTTTHLIDHFHFGPVAPAHSRALPVWTFAVNSLRVNNNSIISWAARVCFMTFCRGRPKYPRQLLLVSPLLSQHLMCPPQASYWDWL